MLLIDPKAIAQAADKVARQVADGIKNDGLLMSLDELEGGPDVVVSTIRNHIERAVLGVTYERRGDSLVRTAL